MRPDISLVKNNWLEKRKINDLSKEEKEILDSELLQLVYSCEGRHEEEGFLETAISEITDTIERGANIYSRSRNTRYTDSMFYAVKHGWRELVELLIESGYNINTYSSSLLDGAIESNQIEILKFLISQGADIETMSLENRRPLEFAVMTSRIEAIKVLMSQEIKSTDKKDLYLALNDAYKSHKRESFNAIIVFASLNKNFHIKDWPEPSLWNLAIIEAIGVIAKKNNHWGGTNLFEKETVIFLNAILTDNAQINLNTHSENDITSNASDNIVANINGTYLRHRRHSFPNFPPLYVKENKLVEELTELRKINLDYFTNKENSYKQKEFTAEEAIAKANKRVYDVIKINSD
ncbi:MAG: ankyrin repeat domain-containing protein, partial [Thermonemataceae bacterium]|nr:ankyrin repeat domain-containing protein [Thermonemataceae bacterium]